MGYYKLLYILVVIYYIHALYSAGQRPELFALTLNAAKPFRQREKRSFQVNNESVSSLKVIGPQESVPPPGAGRWCTKSSLSLLSSSPQREEGQKFAEQSLVPPDSIVELRSCIPGRRRWRIPSHPLLVLEMKAAP